MRAMKTRLPAVALWLALLASSLPAANPAPALPDTFDVQAVDAFLAAHTRADQRVGLSVAIVRDGQIVLARGYGRRSLADGRAVETNTIFAIGSVSKQFTCAAILLLAEDGKLSVNDPVAKYYPQLTRAADISLLDLMNHVSGYPDYYPLDFVDRRMLQPIEEDELLRQYAGGKLDFEPRSKYSYSNTGYILLGRVVEKVSGENLGAFLARRIFRPLGMTQTTYELDPKDPQLAAGYQRFALGAPEVIPPEAAGWLRGAGGIYSTPLDLTLWSLALISGRVLQPESYALMTRARVLSTGRVSDYGCGLRVTTQGGRPVIAHNGAVSGFNAYHAVSPSTRSAVIMICNLEGGMGGMPGQVFSLLLKEPTHVPAIAGPAAPDTVKEIFAQMQKGKVERKRFAEEFNHYLTDEKITGAATRLKSFGQPKRAELLSINERGGLEVTTTRLNFSNSDLRVLMYRRPDGLIEQFFVSRD
jgi:D-alanyl-D-alanine carboxypeptidase